MSQGRRRPRGRGKSPEQSAGGSRKASPPRRKEDPKVDPEEFWGDPAALPAPVESIRGAAEVRALCSSLGRVPLPGQEAAAEHWLALVYERSAVLARALAAASGVAAEEDDLLGH